MVARLQVVLDLPKRMRSALDADVMDSAVGLYAEAQPLLKKFGHRGALRQVASQAELVAKEIAQVLDWYWYWIDTGLILNWYWYLIGFGIGIG